jgi:hypothetical protein
VSNDLTTIAPSRLAMVMGGWIRLTRPPPATGTFASRLRAKAAAGTSEMAAVTKILNSLYYCYCCMSRILPGSGWVTGHRPRVGQKTRDLQASLRQLYV